MDNIILKQIDIKRNLIQFHFEATGKLASFFSNNSLWIEYDQDISQIDISILCVPFVSIMLPIIWSTNGILWVPNLDRTFYDSIFALQRAYQSLYPKLPLKGRIVPSELTYNHIDSCMDSILLFSGGVDAHTSYIRNKDNIKYFVNIQGWLDNPQDESNVVDADKRDILFFATKQKVNVCFVKSNFAKLIKVKSFRKYAHLMGDSLWHGFQHSMAFISIAIPLASKFAISKILIASSFTVADSRVCASYPTTDNEFRFAYNGITIHDGFALSRQDKIRTLVEYQRAIGEEYPIRVCSFNDKNCCVCEKCFRTIMALIAEGADLQKFGFIVPYPRMDFYRDYFEKNIALWGVKNESISHWPHIINRIKENKANIKEIEFVNWFLNYNFIKEKKKAVYRYYCRNFFHILKRKLFSI